MVGATTLFLLTTDKYSRTPGVEGQVKEGQTISTFLEAEQGSYTPKELKQFQNNVWNWNDPDYERQKVVLNRDRDFIYAPKVWWKGNTLMIRAGATIKGPDMNHDGIFGPNKDTIDNKVN